MWGYVITWILGATVGGMGAWAFVSMMPTPETRPGWVSVPVKPTSKMLKAAAKAMSRGARPTRKWVSNRKKHEIRYRAMIDAAQQ